MDEARSEYPVVMRMQGLWPENLGGFEKHRLRTGGDLGHVDPALSGRNQRLLGEENWAQSVYQEIRRMKLENHKKETEKLLKRRRTAELQRRLVEGPRDPWRATRSGPMREVILTAHADWFKIEDGDPFSEGYETREVAFQRLAVEWLRKTFGDDCVHARADRDEKTFHIHAVILPRTVTPDGRRMLQPSKHAVIRDYEEGQNDVGAWFAAAGIGLTRGERRKDAVRNAILHNEKLRTDQGEGRRLDETGQPLPKYRQHVSPRKWRAAQECKLVAREAEVQGREDGLAEREAEVQGREDGLAGREATVAARERVAQRKEHEADEVLAVAQAVADGDLGCEAADPAPEPAQPGEAPPDRPTLARRLFGRALARLRKDERRTARAELKEGLEEIRRADDVIVRIARLLPLDLRKQVAEVRKSLVKSIFRLDPRQGRDRGKPSEPSRE